MEENGAPVKDVQKRNIETELRESYLEYSLAVIVGRAIPDARDGLKPVHRRIMFAQNELSNFYNRPPKKSARIVGDVIGKYHPHGDTAVYDAIVRMAQDFNMRDPLIIGQGNFGSLDGDPPALCGTQKCACRSWHRSFWPTSIKIPLIFVRTTIIP